MEREYNGYVGIRYTVLYIHNSYFITGLCVENTYLAIAFDFIFKISTVSSLKYVKYPPSKPVVHGPDPEKAIFKEFVATAFCTWGGGGVGKNMEKSDNATISLNLYVSSCVKSPNIYKHTHACVSN